MASLPAGAFLAAVRQEIFTVEHVLSVLLFQNPGVQVPGPPLLLLLRNLESSSPGVNLSLIPESVRSGFSLPQAGHAPSTQATRL